jgi:hypothetical protein
VAAGDGSRTGGTGGTGGGGAGGTIMVMVLTAL